MFSFVLGASLWQRRLPAGQCSTAEGRRLRYWSKGKIADLAHTCRSYPCRRPCRAQRVNVAPLGDGRLTACGEQHAVGRPYPQPADMDKITGRQRPYGYRADDCTAQRADRVSGNFQSDSLCH